MKLFVECRMCKLTAVELASWSKQIWLSLILNLVLLGASAELRKQTHRLDEALWFGSKNAWSSQIWLFNFTKHGHPTLRCNDVTMSWITFSDSFFKIPLGWMQVHFHLGHLRKRLSLAGSFLTSDISVFPKGPYSTNRRAKHGQIRKLLIWHGRMLACGKKVSEIHACKHGALASVSISILHRT